MAHAGKGRKNKVSFGYTVTMRDYVRDYQTHKTRITYMDSQLQVPEYLHLYLLQMLLTKNLSCCSIHTDEGVRPGGGDWPGQQHSPDTSVCVLCCCFIYGRQYGNLNMFLVVYACVGQEGYVLRRSADRGESLSWLGFLLKMAWYSQKYGRSSWLKH